MESDGSRQKRLIIRKRKWFGWEIVIYVSNVLIVLYITIENPVCK
jgi:hypothetical protein